MKKLLLWPGLLFISFSWFHLIPIFKEPNYTTALIFLIVGIIFNIFAFWKERTAKVDKRYLIILLPLVFFIIIVPFPYSLGGIILTIAAIFYWFKNFLLKREKENWVFLGISISGIIITIQTMFYPLYTIFVSHGHRADFLSPFVSTIGGFFGLETSVQNGIVFVQTLQKTYAVTTTWEKLGFFTWFNMLIGALILFYFLKRKKRKCFYITGFLVLSGFYLLLRYILVLFYFTQSKDITLFWDANLIFFSFVPFSLLLMRFLPLSDLEINFDCFKSLNLDKKTFAAAVFVFIFIFSLTGAFVFQDPGVEKNGRILIDEYHSSWENTTREMDKEWYGKLSTYNYYNWAEWLDKYYDVEKNIENRLTSEVLKNYDILILKCPTNKYSSQEIRDIVKFVRNGGGLYLIGDHTNVFGMNMYLNQISKKFDIKFKTESTHDINKGGLTTFKTSSLFPHPIVQNMEKFDFKTSCTLEAPLNSENVIIGNQLLGEKGVYSTENFFRQGIGESLDNEYGLLLQVAAVKHGEGRVLAFTDSTCFSNFCMFMDGYKDFNLGSIEYLNRENHFSCMNDVFTVIAGVSLIASLYFLRKKRKIFILYIFLLVGLLSFSVATPIFSNINHSNYTTPTPKEDFTQVCFDTEHSDITLESDPTTAEVTSSETFSTFFVWTQRVGYYPSIEKTLEKAVETGDIIVMINPEKEFKNKEIDMVENYLENGGKVLLMDSIKNTDSTANQLLKRFNMSIFYNDSAYMVTSSGEEHPSDNTYPGNISMPLLTINGGEKVFVTQKNNSVLAVKNIGRGKIVTMVDSYTFSNKIMGNSFTEPNKDLRQIYNFEYYIFEDILKPN
ncbi:MAG: hypothetical protein V5A64_05890 [Candidatus Thermoplasmatota archaeon]